MKQITTSLLALLMGCGYQQSQTKPLDAGALQSRYIKTVIILEVLPGDGGYWVYEKVDREVWRYYTKAKPDTTYMNTSHVGIFPEKVVNHHWHFLEGDEDKETKPNQ